MACFHSTKVFFCMAVALVFWLQDALAADIACEQLDSNTCAFAVSSAGTRCVLEKRLRRGGYEEFYCRSSDINAEKLTGYVETDECIKTCGLNRNTVGISSDSLLEPRFRQKLCSLQCYQVCVNIVDLYFNLAAGEGLFLPKVCEEAGLVSSGAAAGTVAAAPYSGSGELACVPTQSDEAAFAPAPAFL